MKELTKQDYDFINLKIKDCLNAMVLDPEWEYRQYSDFRYMMDTLSSFLNAVKECRDCELNLNMWCHGQQCLFKIMEYFRYDFMQENFDEDNEHVLVTRRKKEGVTINERSYERIVQEIETKITELDESPEPLVNIEGYIQGLRMALDLIEDYKDYYPDEEIVEVRRCSHCGQELIEGKNHSDESYEHNICDDCMELHYGYCDQCGELMQYYENMTNGKRGISCPDCLDKFLEEKSEIIKKDKEGVINFKLNEIDENTIQIYGLVNGHAVKRRDGEFFGSYRYCFKFFNSKKQLVEVVSNEKDGTVRSLEQLRKRIVENIEKEEI